MDESAKYPKNEIILTRYPELGGPACNKEKSTHRASSVGAQISDYRDDYINETNYCCPNHTSDSFLYTTVMKF